MKIQSLPSEMLPAPRVYATLDEYTKNIAKHTPQKWEQNASKRDAISVL